jgi:hypothetical protein
MPIATSSRAAGFDGHGFSPVRSGLMLFLTVIEPLIPLEFLDPD